MLGSELSAATTGKMNTTDSLANDNTIYQRYPLSKRWGFKRCLPMIITCIVLATTYLGLTTGIITLPAILPSEETTTATLRLAQLCLVAMIVHSLYVFTYLRRYNYRIKNGSLIITRGVFLIETGSFPLSRVNDIYVSHDFSDLLLGLRRLHIATASQESGGFANIEGLSYDAAIGLRKELQELCRANRMIEAGNTDALKNEFSDKPGMSAAYFN